MENWNRFNKAIGGKIKFTGKMKFLDKKLHSLLEKSSLPEDTLLFRGATPDTIPEWEKLIVSPTYLWKGQKISLPS